MRISVLATAAVAVGLGLSAPAAFADANTSANWSGYAAHRPGITFSNVTASWIQPNATCTHGQRSYSAFWVGLGGYSRSAVALEQIGTEVDCSASGKVKSTAWWELVPAGSRPVHIPVRPGDKVDAAVTVTGNRVALMLHDATTGRRFAKTVTAPVVDVSSAEWIAEAPSVCFSVSTCDTLPLANFGRTKFTAARAETASGVFGPISDTAWSRTKINLTPGGRRMVRADSAGTNAGEATPSALRARGSAFTVTYSQVAVPRTDPVLAQRASVSEGRIVH
jgi:hypothetical protein